VGVNIDMQTSSEQVIVEVGMGAGEEGSSHDILYDQLDGIVNGGEHEERGITLLQRRLLSQVDTATGKVSEEGRVELENMESLHKKLKKQSYDDNTQDNVTSIDVNECEVKVSVGNGETIMAQEEESQEEVVVERVVDGTRRSFMSKVNEFMGQVSEINRLEVKGRRDPGQKSKRSRGGIKQRQRDEKLMELKQNESNRSVSLSETADTDMLTSQISQVHQPVPSLPSVFSSKTARKHYLQRRKQATKQKPRHMKAWEFFRKDDDD
jgi:hypothetical protein